MSASAVLKVSYSSRILHERYTRFAITSDESPSIGYSAASNSLLHACLMLSGEMASLLAASCASISASIAPYFSKSPSPAGMLRYRSNLARTILESPTEKVFPFHLRLPSVSTESELTSKTLSAKRSAVALSKIPALGARAGVPSDAGWGAAGCAGAAGDGEDAPGIPDTIICADAADSAKSGTAALKKFIAQYFSMDSAIILPPSPTRTTSA